MAVRKYKPTTPGRRGASVSAFDEITRSTPEKSLLAKGRKKAGPQRPRPDHHAAPGRRHTSAGTASSTSGGTRTACRPRSRTIEYDPNRSARIALLHYADGEKRYILAPDGVRVGRHADVGRRMPRSARATRCRCATSRSAPWCTRSS